MQDGRHRGRVFGKFLSLAEAEQNHLESVVVEESATKDAFFGRLNLLGQIEKMGVGCRHCGVCSFLCPINMIAARWFRYLEKTRRIARTLRRAARLQSRLKAKRKAPN